jgi:hypothetical protein
MFDFIGGLVSGHWISRRFRSTAERSTEPWRKKARVTRQLVLPTGLHLSEERCRRVLSAFGEERPVYPPEPGVIEVIGRSSWRTTGTVLQARLRATDTGGTNVVLAAWPGAQLFDWGESRRLCAEVAKRLAV